jgi:hypothetical protein
MEFDVGTHGLAEHWHWEWGVWHSQGIRSEWSEKTARESLEWMIPSYERSQRRGVKPVIVRRRVSDWTPYDEQMED